ncbi:glycosyltransferase family 4 protein [Streptomyces griseorubiginosus]|uniref:glycosyltransferase family 4 protein n=1 Tax=Streptomyces griseorubiginosus TaxID=67304 RepID=UPI002E80878E|nr:glycosyltransferase family 4 protein [Streptomyces griseorubiginosus]WUB45564.1 glycosyltransferase family 4 protein [Streptomyces griseorubiginosus]WUB54082.1 glycosyltransferase family 4 protein [Streptomyces griseorubiginosus]
MRIAVVHSFYTAGKPSGENALVRDQVRALGTAGHTVELFAAHTDELARDPLYPLRAAARVASGRGNNPLARLRDFAPDLVHVHNLFPNFGRSWVRQWAGPLVATLHNYRPMCAAATLYRAGAVCTRCPGGDPWAALRFGCYRGSRAATLPLAWAGRHGPARDPLLARADRLVVNSRLSEETYRQAGVPAGRLSLVPNFVDAPVSEEAPDDATGRWLVAARLSAEKGVLELLRQWPADAPLDVFGDGELLAECRAAAPSSVRFLGRLDRAELCRRMPAYRGLVFPSRWYEVQPCVQVEALAAGLPTLAFEGSSVADAVREHGTGLVTRWDQPLARVLAEAADRFPSLRAHCRQVYTDRFTERAWLARIAGVYEEATRVAGDRATALA